MNDSASTPPPGLAVFVSGMGRTLENLAQRIANAELPARIVLVVGSRECPALEKARLLGLRTEVHPGQFTAGSLAALLTDAGADWVVLAGYTKLLPIPEGFGGRMVNIHPALLPSFGGKGMYGLRVHEAVIAAGAATSGCTVHLCDGRYDTGPIVAQATCVVRADDTPQTLAARVFELEKELYPRALAQLLRAASRSGGDPAGGRRAARA